MATHAPTTGAPTRAPSIARRGLLAGLALAPAAAIPLPALAKPAPDTTEWDQALIAARAADAAFLAISDREQEAVEAFEADCEAIKPRGLEERAWAPIHHQLHLLPLDAIASLYQPPHFDVPEEHRAKMGAEVKKYRERRAQLAARYRVKELEADTAAASTAALAALERASLTPAPTATALAEKLELFLEFDVSDTSVRIAIADARRLAGRG